MAALRRAMLFALAPLLLHRAAAAAQGTELGGPGSRRPLPEAQGYSFLQHVLVPGYVSLARTTASLVERQRHERVWRFDTCVHADSESRTSHPLTFIHIPRTAGTSIEDCTKHEPEEFRWGVQNPMLHGREKNWTKCYRQHVPPNLLPDVYRGRETFCVVRDPYARAISQIGFMSAFFGRKWACNATSLNKYLLDRLSTLREKPCKDDCHLLPQAAYVLGWDAKAKEVNRLERSCGTILRYETLVEDFNRMMEERGLSYRLSRQTVNPNTASNSACHLLTADDLTEDVRKLIEEHYQVDFQLFGYPTISGSQ